MFVITIRVELDAQSESLATEVTDSLTCMVEDAVSLLSAPSIVTSDWDDKEEE